MTRPMAGPHARARTIACVITLMGVAGARASAQHVPAPPPAADAAQLESYRAHLGAAEASLRLSDAVAAREWLDGAPAARRGWEWSHLDALTDQSLLSVVAHDGEPVFGVRVAPDGATVLSAGFDGTARLWDAAALADGAAPLDVYAGHTDGLWAAAFLDEGARVVTASGDRTARLFATGSAAPLGTLWSSDTPVSCVDVSPDGTLVAASAYRWVHDEQGQRVAVEGLVRLFDAATGAERHTLVGGGKPISLIRFAPDGTRLAAACWDARVHVWDVDATAPVLALDMQQGERYSAVDALAWSPDGRTIAAGAKSAQVRLFDAATGARLRELDGHVGALGGVAFHPAGEMLASGGEDGTVRLWDAASGRPLAVLHGHDDFVRGLAFSPDGTRLYSGADDGTLRVWDADVARAGGPAFVHDAAYTLAFAPDGRTLATSSYDGTIVLADPVTGAVRATLDLGGPSLNVVAFAPDGARLAVARSDGDGQVVDARTGAVLAELGDGGSGASAIAWSPDGGAVAVVHYDDVARLLDAKSGEERWRADGTPGPANSLAACAFLPDGSALAAPFGSGARVLDAADGATRRAFDGARERVLSVAVTPDGRVLLGSCADGRVLAWDVASGAPLWSARGHRARAGRVRVGPDGTRAVSVAHDVVVWDVASGTPLLRLRPHAGGVYDAAFSPDGTRLATLGHDGRVRLHDGLSVRARRTLAGG